MSAEFPEQTTQEDKEGSSKASLSAKWTRTVNQIRRPIITCIQSISGASARNPRTTIVTIVCVSLVLMGVGLLTNFNIETNEENLWTPKRSKALEHMEWIRDESGFETTPRYFYLLFHRDGESVLGREEVRRVFQAFDTLQSTKNFHQICAAAPHGYCDVQGIVNFWNQSSAIFESQVSSDEDVVKDLSAKTYPDGKPVAERAIFGTTVRDNATGLLLSSEAYWISIGLPETEDVEQFEEEALDALFALGKSWEAEGLDGFNMEMEAERSFSDEFTRSIAEDIPLVPVVFIIMSIFTAFVFASKDPVRSQSLLGFGAVVSVMLSIMSGYGLMFICGVPFTSMTQILPFIIFGIGLDDAYIIHGSYNRLPITMPVQDRIQETMGDIGASIALTTATSTLAFGLGCISSVPAVFWLCLYAFPTIFLVLLYQITFFVACTVLDDKRMREHRRDCCCTCLTAPVQSDEEPVLSTSTPSQKTAPDRFMGWYARQLLRPSIQTLVLFFFTGLAVLSAFSATKLRQEFKVTDVLPNGSYLSDYYITLEDRMGRIPIRPHVYFRFVDQSDHLDDMELYLQELNKIPAVDVEPEFVWFRDFKAFVTAVEEVQDLDFNEQVAQFLAVPVFGDLYRDNIVIDENTGDVLESRCYINMGHVDVSSVRQQMNALLDQRDVTKAQAVNKGKEHWPFMTYYDLYNIWEFYVSSIDELILTTITGVASVTFLAFISVPHWTAALFVFPLISVLYVDLLGFLQWTGVTINVVSYVTLVMSIGLLVDFIMHVLLRYFEVSGTRKERVIDCLETMGTSITIGGISTFLGILPLAFSKSEIFTTVFLAFLGLVILGCAHGLILLPVVLSLIGPENQLQLGSGNLATNSASTGESEAESHISAVLENQQDKPEQAICDDSSECEA